jgi:regulator of protease activity HflC (stomatin/prohibitin superfamily)
MAVDVWREYLSKFTLDELFDPDTALKKGIVQENQTGKPVRRETGLEIIKRMVNERFKTPKVDELDEFGSITGQQVVSREYQLVTNMGIQVFAISLSDLCFPPSIEERLVQQWISTWLERAEKDRIRVEQLRSYTQIEGEKQALKAFANAAASRLAESLESDREKTSLPGQGASLDLKASLELLLSGTYQMCISDTSLQNLLDNQEKDLWKLLEWVRSQ